MTIELFIIVCLTFFKIFSVFISVFTPAIVLNVSFGLLTFDSGVSTFDSVSFQRNSIISLSCVQNLLSSSGESEIQESFWRCLISWVKSVIDHHNNKVLIVYKNCQIFQYKNQSIFDKKDIH